jgi:hypothetical protein
MYPKQKGYLHDNSYNFFNNILLSKQTVTNKSLIVKEDAQQEGKKT